MRNHYNSLRHGVISPKLDRNIEMYRRNSRDRDDSYQDFFQKKKSETSISDRKEYGFSYPAL